MLIDGACTWCIYWGLKMELVYVVPRSLDILICTSGIHLTHLIVTYIYIHIHTYTQCIYWGLCHYSTCVWDDRCWIIYNTIYIVYCICIRVRYMNTVYCVQCTVYCVQCIRLILYSE